MNNYIFFYNTRFFTCVSPIGKETPQLVQHEIDFEDFEKLELSGFELSLLLHHPHIVHTCAIYEDIIREKIIIIQAYLPGITLENYIIYNKNRIDKKWIISVLSQIADALAYLHSNGLVFNDLKTTNIIYNPQLHHITLIDTTTISDEKQKERAWTTIFAAPEMIDVLSKHLPKTSAVDMWSLGAILYELLKGYDTWPVKTAYDAYHVSNKQKNVLSSFDPTGHPPMLVDILYNLLDYNPRTRLKATPLLRLLKQRRISSSNHSQTHITPHKTIRHSI